MPDDRRDREHQFGGEWTTRKLEVLAGYLQGYTTALKKTPFQKLYIDAFAGTGYRDTRRDNEENSPQDTLFPDMAEPEPQSFLDGSARLALKIEPPFDHYIFIERSPECCADLVNLKSEFPGVANKIDIRQGDANAKIHGLCRHFSGMTMSV